MLVEQSIEVELMGPESPGLTCTPTAAYFHDKTKTSTENLLADH